MPFVPVAGPGFDAQKETGGFVPVSAKLFGEEHPIVGELPSPYRGVASKPVVSFRLPTEDDPEHRIFLSPSDDGGLPNVLKKVGGSFVVSGRFDDGRRDAADAGQLRPLDRPFVPAKPAVAEGSPDPLAILSQPSVMSLLKSRNPERWRSEVEPLLQQADEFGRHPFEKADAKIKAAKILNEMMPEGGLGTQYQSEKKQVASGRKVMQRPTIIDSNGRVQYFPELKPRENVGDEVPIDEGVLRGDHEAARLEYQRSKRPDSVIGRQAERLRAGVEGVSGALWRPFLPQDVSDELVRNQESQGQAFNEVSGPIERQVGGAIQSAGTMLAAAPVAAMTGPAAPLVFGGAAGLSTGNQALTQATDAGLSGEQRIGHALMQGGLEAGVSGVFSKVLGMPGMEGALSRALGQRITSQSAAKIGALVAGRLAKAGIEEVPEELVTSAAQNAASRLSGVDPNKGLLDPEEAADVIVQSFIGGAGANLPGSVLGARRENPTAYKNLTRDLPIGSNPTTKTGEKVRIVGYDDQNVVVQPVQTVGGKEKLVGEKRTVPQSELKPEFTPYEHSREFADKWAAENPEAAKALAAKAGEQPSIADFEKAGLNRRGVSSGQRKEFADWLAEGELLRSKPAASTDTGFMTPPVEQPKQLGPDVPKRVTDRMKNALANRGFDRAFIDTLSQVQAQAILANRKGTKLGQKAEVPPTDEAAIAPKTEARDALIKFVAEKNYSDPNRFEFRDADLEYQRLKAAYDAEIRSNAARKAAKSRRETSAEREQAQAAIEEGLIDRENAKFAPLNMMDEQLAQKIREEAKSLIEESDSEETRAALQKIIDGDDVNAGGKVESEKERIIKILSGELDKRTGNKKKSEAPRPADAIATSLLKSPEERQSDIDEAVKALADGTPNTIVDEARRLAGEELNQDRDIELPYLEPGEQQILDKIDEIAGKLGVEPKGKSVIEGMEDDSFDFGANVEEKSSDEDFEASLNRIRDEVSKEFSSEDPKPKKLGEKTGERASEIMAKVRRDANQRDLEDHERSLSGVNFWGRGIDPELGDQFDAHGLSAQDLQSLLENGIDENRPFHTAKISDPADGLGLRDHQPFVVVGHPGKGLKEGGIRAVVVDPLHTPSIPDLQKAFPGVQFIPAENSAIELTKIAKEEGSPAKPKKLGPAAEQPAKSDTVAERYRRTSGNELGDIVAPKTQSQQDAVDFFKARGKTVKFFAPPNNSQAASFFDPKTGDVYLNANVSDAERFSYLIGHEYAHASGADSRLADLPKQLLDSAKSYYLERSNPNYRQKLLDDDALLTREAVAVFVGRVFSNSKYRSLIRNENPGVLEKIVEFVKSLFVGDDYAKLPEAVRRVVDELNSHVQPKGRKLGGGDGNRYDTYAGFAEPNRGTAAGKLGAAVAEAMGENEKPKWSMEDVAEGAIAAEAKNPEKARAEIEKLLKGDAPLTKEQTALANVVKRRLASEYVKTGDAAALKEYIDFKQRYFAKRSQAGDILRVGQEDLFSKLETREGREQALADALLDMTPKEVERLDAAVKKLREAGIDEEDLLFSEAWHGSPALHDKFSTDYMGTGEGAQVYGWGLYFASAKKVAEWYREKFTPGKGGDPRDTAARIYQSMPATMSESKKREEVIRELELRKERAGNDPEFNKRMDEAIAATKAGSLKGYLYRVDLKPAEDQYLLWDKPLSEQSEYVKDALREFIEKKKRSASKSDPGWGDLSKPDLVPGMTYGKDVYDDFRLGYPSAGPNRVSASDAKRLASEKLLSLGIRGIKYLDGVSRSDGEGSYNYVIFDDSDVEITGMALSDEDYLGNALNQKSDSERKKLGEAKKKADAARPLLEGRQAEAEYRHVLGSIEARQAAFRKQMIDKGVIPKSQAEYEKFIKDPLKVQQAIIEINAHKSSAADRLLEYWYNAVLSAPTTHVKNVTGNVINGGRMAAVGFTKLIGEVATLQKKPEHAVSELAAFWSGFWGGLMPAARNFTTAWNTELSALARKVGRDKRSSPLEWAEGVASIPGTLGRVIRYPKRFMLAVDEFFKTLTVHMNVGVEAHRLAVEEGKSGKELAKRQAELVADPTSLAWNRAYDTALEVSMQEEGGKFRQGVKHAIAAGRRIPYAGYVSKFLVPFTNIAINSAAQVGLQSPLGMIPAVAKVVSNIRNGDPMFQGMSNDLARQAVGFAATMAIYSLVGDDNDDEKVTILGKDSKEHKYSIKFGDRYFTYSGIEPIGSFLGLIADASQSAKSGGDAMAMFGDLARSVGNQLAEKPLLGAVTEAAKFATADFGEQVTSEKAAGALMAWAARFGGSFVPAIAKAPERALRGEAAERMTWKGNTTEETLGRLGERALSKTDLGLVEEASKFDKWGRKYPETAIEGHPIADFLFRMLSPGKLIKYEPHDGDKLIAKWNNANPKEVYNPSVLDPFYTLNGEKTYFTDKQYARYAEHTGKLASKLFELGKFDAENPTAEQVDAIRDNFTAAKAAIKEHLHEEILAGKQSPIDLDTLAKRLTIKMRKTAAEKLSEGLGARKLGESDATREMKRQKWQEARGQALARLQRLSSD